MSASEDLDEVLAEIERAIIRLSAIHTVAAAAVNDPDAESFDSAITQLLLSASILLAMRRKANQIVKDFQEAANAQ